MLCFPAQRLACQGLHQLRLDNSDHLSLDELISPMQTLVLRACTCQHHSSMLPSASCRSATCTHQGWQHTSAQQDAFIWAWGWSLVRSSVHTVHRFILSHLLCDAACTSSSSCSCRSPVFLSCIILALQVCGIPGGHSGGP